MQTFRHIHQVLDAYLSKAKRGEGSRGGHIIGHTESGKPIYQSQSARHYTDYSTADHIDAHLLHNKKSEEAYAEDRAENARRDEEKIVRDPRHWKRGMMHQNRAGGHKQIVFRNLGLKPKGADFAGHIVGKTSSGEPILDRSGPPGDGENA